jgi:hypothetical protein
MEDMGSARVQAEAAAMLRRLLEKVEQGELEAKGGQGAPLLRRLEGAATVWEESARRKGTKGT